MRLDSINGKFRTIVADPPWKITRPADWHTNENHQGLDYPTMEITDIKELDVKSLRDEPSFLFLWTVNAYIEKSYQVARSWGFRPVSLLTWCKTPRGTGPGGMFSSTTEFILFARHGSCKQGRRKVSNTTWFNWSRTQYHSKKPEEFYRMVEENFPTPRLELFARQKRSSWTVWGDEVNDG